MDWFSQYIPSWMKGTSTTDSATTGTIESAPPVSDTPAGEGGVGGRRRKGKKSKKTRRTTKRSRSGRKSSRL